MNYADWAKDGVLACANWIKGLQENDATSDVVWCLELVNEPQLGGDENAQCEDGSGRVVGDAMVDWFQDIIPKVRDILPADKYAIMQGFLT